ncbi:hypothetical protein DFS34DRAFT_581979 [Phlyctochytrium arcticum]|nr:hypothetical protein DFS34DRAFT_581979 [Phlyctochytrium arcticum]
MSTQFLKRCMAEDVEPCLFYIYHPEAGTLFKQGTGLSTSAKKRLLDNLVRGWCEVSLHTKQRSSRSSGQGKTPSSPLSAPQQPVNAMPRASGQSAIRQKCHSCALHRDCDYRVRFGPPRSAASDMQRGTAADDTWQPICRFCKDRLLSVGDFFSFLSRLREGVKQGASILSMFRQALLLRRRMSASRIGSISLFELEGYASRLELNTDWEKCVQIHS